MLHIIYIHVILMKFSNRRSINCIFSHRRIFKFILAELIYSKLGFAYFFHFYSYIYREISISIMYRIYTSYIKDYKL